MKVQNNLNTENMGCASHDISSRIECGGVCEALQTFQDATHFSVHSVKLFCNTRCGLFILGRYRDPFRICRKGALR